MPGGGDGAGGHAAHAVGLIVRHERGGADDKGRARGSADTDQEGEGAGPSVARHHPADLERQGRMMGTSGDKMVIFQHATPSDLGVCGPWVWTLLKGCGHVEVQVR